MACCRRVESPCLAALYMRVARAMTSGGSEASEDDAPGPVPELLMVKILCGERS